MNFSDKTNPLRPILDALEAHCEVLGKARNTYLAKEAERRHHEASLVTHAPGKSHAERLINAQASESWVKFSKELARLEAIYEFQRLKFTVLEKEWTSYYLEMKLNESLIKKQE